MVGQNPRRLAAALLVAATAACGPSEPAPTVLLDGLFDEWTTAANVIDDARDAVDSEVDLLSVQALDDPRWLYLALDMGNEVALQSMPGTLHLLFDVDHDRGTGDRRLGMDGVDLIVDLSPLTSLRASPGAGIRVRAVADDGTERDIERHTLGVMAAPTWSAPRFEMRISRLSGPDAPSVEGRLRMSAVYELDDHVLDETAVGSYALRTERAEGPALPAGRLPEKPGDATRVVQWNVSSGSFERYPSDFARVLAALRPDVVMLDEVSGTMSREALRRFFDLSALRSIGEWSFVLGDRGGRQRSLVAARSGSIRPSDHLRAPGYPPGAFARVRATADIDSSVWERLVRSERLNGLSAAGAWVSMGDVDALFVSLDLQAAGWPGSPHDLLRTVQAEVVRDHVLTELGGRSHPVVIGGDLNLVGSRTPLFTLVRGLDVDGTDLTPVEAERLGERSLATWRMPGQFFGPGRLDFLLVPDAAFSIVQAFVFATEDLEDAELARLGLERDLMLERSDHLVLVADVRLRPEPVPVGESP